MSSRALRADLIAMSWCQRRRSILVLPLNIFSIYTRAREAHRTSAAERGGAFSF